MKAVPVSYEGISDYNMEKPTGHLHAWFLNNMPEDKMIYKASYEDQVMFVRDTLRGLLGDSVITMEVISTHTSKSIKLPVYRIMLGNSTEIIMRGNFHNWQISVNSKNSIIFPELLTGELSEEKELLCYCEGFEEEWIYDSYKHNNQKFTISIGYNLYLLFTFFFLIKNQYR
jgi:hypothetical protein